jgi:hypothetical protein
MKKAISLLLITLLSVVSCKKQLDVENPNEPTLDALSTEEGVMAMAQGGIYLNGMVRALQLTWHVMGFHEHMGDITLAEAANWYSNQISSPDKITLGNGTVLLNPNSPPRFYDFFRSIDGYHFSHYEWRLMYNMIASANAVLVSLPQASLTGDTTTKANTLRAWAYFWKGFAYARIGSLYYAGIINNEPVRTNNKYVSRNAILSESNLCFDLAIASLNRVKSTSVYATTVERLIPSFCQRGKGLPPTVDMWIRNINTMKARTLLVNKVTSEMTASDWNNMLSLAGNGIRQGDYIFTARTDQSSDLIFQLLPNGAQGAQAGGAWHKLSERWVQDFRAGDRRYENNIRQSANPWIGASDRGNSYNTRFILINGGKGLPGAWVYANTATGAIELPLAGSFEENQLMQAEALMYTGKIEQGLQLIDEVRSYMGAGLAPLAGTGLSASSALEELRSERRIALAFRGLSFYDARRWKVSEPAAAGGGRRNCTVVDFSGVVHTDATIEYGYLDYWDVPPDELHYNPPGEGSAPVKNPKQ